MILRHRRTGKGEEEAARETEKFMGKIERIVGKIYIEKYSK